MDRRLITIYEREVRYIDSVIAGSKQGTWHGPLDGHGRPIALLPQQRKVITDRIAELREGLDRKARKAEAEAEAAAD